MAELNKPLTTRIIPHQFLKQLFLVGHVPQRALTSDPRLSYSLYVPQEHYPKNSEQKLPLLVHVHGTSRDLSPVRRELVAFADSMPCAILAPLFPANLEGPTDFNSYKDLRTNSLRSDLALISMLDEVAFTWPGIETSKIHLMGFSAGGQFAHRFLYLYPEHLASVSVGSPGQATPLDYQKNWPKGVADVESIFNKTVREELIKEVAIQLVIGADDVIGHGSSEFRQWARKMTTALAGKEAPASIQADVSDSSLEVGNRVDTIKRLHTSWKELEIEARLDIVDGVAHKSAGAARE
ncbi:hypothetical protein UA08_09398 [Talaromyces atroroseus]|uniref:Uncharacterized protein n=1 Tax=Talaromyces atroroseus TaxID=1441469 RepID=A0A1Q5Q6G7_TALAT|nr:hypothetical protein UA08_09398 [Talaromyces atroroseus]OKL55363.1 hypothetical protein UA08_09398 [Talaromyces atroroseus]